MKTKRKSGQKVVREARARVLKDRRVFEGLSKIEYDAFAAIAHTEFVSLETGTVLIEEGEKTETFWIIALGRLRGARYYYDGTLDLVQMYAEGDIVGLDVTCTKTKKSPLEIASMEDAELVSFDISDFGDARLPTVTRDKLRGNIVRLLADESIRKQYKIDVLYQKSLRRRIAVFLRHMSEKKGSPSFEINMDREQFARYLGVNRSALSHTLSVMRKDGVISFRKGHFEILDKQALDEKET
ncbi:MAG: Crp/Fnr family transcriptional regulator [Clostridiales Family XIII bacterium]|nr:Crp/Fnr family transcriptional regulator [Clostridiales Family XIII bacterium]